VVSTFLLFYVIEDPQVSTDDFIYFTQETEAKIAALKIKMEGGGQQLSLKVSKNKHSFQGSIAFFLSY
jgi:hypothetical protein